MGLWSEENIERVKILATAGYSASQIANEIGGVTRNAVVGIGHRNSITFHGSYSGGPPRGPRLPRLDSAPKMFNPKRSWLKCTQVAEPIEIREVVKFVDLQVHMCHWPIGDPIHPDFGYCGANKHDEYSYCANHCRIAFETPEERRARTISSR